MFTRKRIIIAIVVILLGLAAWYYFANQSKTKVTSSTTAETGDIAQTIVLSGEIQALEHAQVHFQSGGMLAWVGVKEGDTVTKYQALASLDKAALRKSLDQKLNNYMATRWNFEQTQDDNRDWQVDGMTDDERTSIKRIVDKSQFGLNVAVLDVELQDLVIRYATITSPIAGRVIRAEPNYSGVNINPSTSVYEIVNPSSIYFDVSADQTEVVDFQIGQTVAITLDSFADQQVMGRVSYISYTPDTTQTGTVYRIRVESTDLASNNQTRLGMTGDAEFVTDQKNQVVLIPNQYIQTDDDGNQFVWVDGGKTKAMIKTGLENETHTEIVEGLTAGQQIYQIDS